MNFTLINFFPLFFSVKIPSESKDDKEKLSQDAFEDGRAREKNITQQSNIRPQRSFMKPRSLVQPLPSCLTSVPSLNSVLAPIASPEVVNIDKELAVGYKKKEKINA